MFKSIWIPIQARANGYIELKEFATYFQQGQQTNRQHTKLIKLLSEICTLKNVILSLNNAVLHFPLAKS